MSSPNVPSRNRRRSARARGLPSEAAHIASLSGKLRHIEHDRRGGAAFVDLLLSRCMLRNMAELSRLCDVPLPVLSKVRHGHIGVSDRLLLAVHDAFGIDIATLKDMLHESVASRGPDGGDAESGADW